MKRNATAALAVIFGLASGLAAAAPQGPRLEVEKIRQGWRVFNERQCASCHAIWGEGAHLGPDLGRLESQFWSAGQLAGVMWNHAPEMWSRMVSRGIPVEPISDEEMQSLFLFLYFVRFVDEPGDPVRGEALASRKKCVSCHATQPGEASVGPSFRTMGSDVNPVIWAHKLWNHAPEMYGEMRRQGLSWPTFEGEEMVDLVAYVRSISGPAQRTYLEPGDEVRGRTAFRDLGCLRCHERAVMGAPAVKELARNPRTIGQMAGELWNHAPAMAEAAETAGSSWATMTPQQMIDLITYFFSLRFYHEEGNPERGSRLFHEKRCDACHGEGRTAPDLRGGGEGKTAIWMARFMWQHGLEMRRMMEEMRVPWPTFAGNEFVDLLAFLGNKSGER